MASGRHETFELPRVAEEPLKVAGIPAMLEQMFDTVKGGQRGSGRRRM
jgi:hypothetical protein